MTAILLLLMMSLLQTSAASAGQPDSLVNDVRKLEVADSNQARFEALSRILRERNVTFEVQPFTIEKPIGKEPRTDGRNVVASFGDGPQEIVVGAHYDAARLADGSLSRGAVDNAASTIILVRLAERLAADKLTIR